MPEDHVAIVRRVLKRWESGDYDQLSDLMTPDGEMVSPLSSVRGRPLHDFREVGDAVLALGRVRLKGRGSGVELDQPFTWLASFAEDGRIRRVEVFTDRREAFAAAGLAVR